jgi:hypothetical protein
VGVNVKIAYEKKLPGHSEWMQLLDGTAVDGETYTRFIQYGPQVVAAYDGDRLVGLGGFQVKASDREGGEEWAVVIHPSYARRDIEHYMKKLL